MDQGPNLSSTVFARSLSFFSCGQPDDDHVWSKHVADQRTKYTVALLRDLYCNPITLTLVGKKLIRRDEE
jgi:hypothetical protein